MTRTELLSTSVAERFLRYVQVDTQSADRSSTYPSTLKQLVLLDQLVKNSRPSASPMRCAMSTVT